MNRLQRLVAAQQGTFHGSIDGRIREAQPVGGRGTDWAEIDDADAVGQPPDDGTTDEIKFMQDRLDVIALGDQILYLSFVPILNSEHLYWEGVYQPGTEWTRSEKTVGIPDPDGVIEIDDELVMEYAYRVGDPTADAVPDPDEIPLECLTMTVRKPTYGAPYISYDGSHWFWTRDMTFKHTWKSVATYPLKAVGYYVFQKTGGFAGYPYRDRFEGPWDTSAHGSAPAGLDYGLGVNGGASFASPGTGGSPAGVETTFVDIPRLSFGSAIGPGDVPALDMDLIGFGYFVPSSESSSNLPQVNPNGLIGLTDPAQCMWYWGTKIADTDDDRDVPIGGV